MDYKNGHPSPLGVSFSKDWYNFAIYSKNATAGFLVLYVDTKRCEIPLSRTGNIWHVTFEPPLSRVEYAVRFEGPRVGPHLFDSTKELLDPYARALNTPFVWGDTPQPLRGVLQDISFSWDGVKKPLRPLSETVVYECHLRGMSKQIGSQSDYLSMIDFIPYFVEMGITAIELLPVFEFNERSHKNFEDPNPLYNFWGYSTVSFFSPMQRFAKSNPQIELKEMVKAFHKARIEVYLDVVYNHTNEGDSKAYYESMRGVDNATYYIVDDEGNYYNYSGCGNTVRCNHPYTAQFIVDSLAFWADEYQIDGFRFDLASILTRDVDGTPLRDPPLIEMIESHPSLKDVKLFAEAWDCGGLYQVGSFPGKRFSEWNGVYRDTVRRYINGLSSDSHALFSVFCGSPHMYDSPEKSVNFVTAHDGFTLADLCSYNEKRNAANRENNRDGHNQNESWNCGVEGETTDSRVLKLRDKQRKNFLLTLLLSKGVPMLWMGDEYGHSRGGNNNAWCQDNSLNYFDWDRKDPSFIKEALRIRREVIGSTYKLASSEMFVCDMEHTLFLLNAGRDNATFHATGSIVLTTDEGVVSEDGIITLPSHSAAVVKKV